MKIQSLRIVAAGLLLALIVPTIALACRNYVYFDADPEGYYICGDNTYPYYRNPHRNVLPGYLLPRAEETGDHDGAVQDRDRLDEERDSRGMGNTIEAMVS